MNPGCRGTEAGDKVEVKEGKQTVVKGRSGNGVVHVLLLLSTHSHDPC